jgi:sec-independent protein translocase protein TatC
LSFVLFLPLGFGVSFQLPLVMLFLERIGIFNVKTYLGHWRIAVLVIAFISMVLTPAEPYSMMLMCAPLIGLYFFGVALCAWMPRRKTPFGDVIE